MKATKQAGTSSIVVEFGAALDVKGCRSGETLVVAEGSTLAGLLRLLGIQPEHQMYVRGFINSRAAGSAAVLPWYMSGASAR